MGRLSRSFVRGVLALGFVLGTADWAYAQCTLASATVWNAASGVWNVASNWTPAAVPNSTATNVCLTNGTVPTPASTTLNISASTASLQLGTSNSLTINNALTLTIAPGSQIINGGAITLNSTGSNTNLYLGSGALTTTLSGGGTITLTNAASRIYGDGSVVLHNVNNTIQGQGSVGVSTNGSSMINGAAGVVDANVNGAVLGLNWNQGMTNQGTLTASNGGILSINTTVLNGGVTPGLISSTGGGVVRLLSGSVIRGGTLNGDVRTNTGAATLDGNSQGTLTNLGSITLINGTQLTIGPSGTINNQGSITVDSTGSNTFLYLGSAILTTTLQGGGTVTLQGQNSFVYGDGQSVLDNVDNTFQGEGNFGSSVHSSSFINRVGGLVNANVNGAVLLADWNQGITNQGTMTATGGGILGISTIINNNGGLISTDSGNNSLVRLQSGSIVRGGTLNGVFRTVSGTATLDGSSQGTLTNLGSITLANGTQLTIGPSGTINNQGSITVDGTGSNTFLYLGSGILTTTLQGGGTITLQGQNSFVYGDGQSVLDNVNNTFQGEGNFGSSVHSSSFINRVGGLVNANVNGAVLLADWNQGITNQGTMTATGGGILGISTDINNNGGSISTDSGNGSLARLDNGSVIRGGTLSGAFRTNTGTATLDGLSQGTLTTTGTIDVLNGTTLLIGPGGTINNQGSITVNGATSNTFLWLGSGSATTTLQGGGTVTLQGPNAFIYGDGSGVLDNVDNTFQGQGNFGSSVHGSSMINRAGGLVNANVNGQTLLVDWNQGVTNHGVLTASNGGILEISTTISNGLFTPGLISSTGGGIVRLDGSAIVRGGTLNGNVQTSGNASLDGASQGTLTNLGTITLNNGHTLTIGPSGTFHNQGGIIVNSGVSNTNLYLGSGAGTTTLQGGGTLTLVGANARVYGDGSSVLSNFDNLIQGQGQFGLSTNGSSFINGSAGTVLANVNGATLNVAWNQGQTNNGTFQANAGSTLAVTTALTNLSGVAGSTMSLTGGTYHANDGTIRINGFGTMAGGGELRNNIANIILNGANGLLVDQNGNRALRNLSGNQGSLTVTGGRVFSTDGSQNNNLINTGSVFVGTGSTINIGSTGQLSYTQNAGMTTVNGAFNAGGSFSVAGGTVFGNGGTVTSANSSFGVASFLNPGANATTPGTLAFMGPLDLQGTLNEVITGVGGGQFGLTNVTGPLTLGAGSTLNLAQSAGMLNGSTAAPIGSVLTIMTNLGPRTGTFGSVTNANFNNGQQSWGVIYNANNVQLGAMANAPIDATWTGPSGTWTSNSGASAFTTNWACSIGGFSAPVINGCVPNNGRDGLGNNIAFANANYNAILNSAGNTMTLNSGPGGIITINSVNNMAGNLVVTGGMILNAATFTNAGNVTVDAVNNAIGTGAMVYTQTAGTTTVNSNLNATVNINGGTLKGNNGLNGFIAGTTTIGTGGRILGGTSTTTPGTLRLNGALNLNGSLGQVITGASAGNFGVVNVNGAVNLGASSVIDLFHSAGVMNGSTVIPVGTVLTFMTATAGSGAFSGLNNNTFNNGNQQWQLVSNPGSLQLAAVAPGAINATWTGASGNWTANFGGGSTNWNCSIAVINGCVPNNGRDGAGNAILGANYNATLNSAGNTMTLSNGSSPSSVTVNALNNLGGTLQVDAAFLTATSTAAMTNAGTMRAMNGGVLTLGSTAVNNTGGTIHSNGQVNFTNGTTITGGTVSGFGGSFGGAITLANGTTLLVGADNNTPTGLSFTGGLTLSNGSTMTAVLNNTNQGSGYSVLSMNGSPLVLGTTSTLNLLTNGSYSNGAVLTIAQGGSVTGTFGTVNGLTFNSGTQTWVVNYLANSITLTAQGVAANLVTATWNTGTGNWDDAVAGRFDCTPGTTPCLPNNNVTTNYNVVLNSAGNTLTLDGTSTPAAITVDNVTGTAGTLSVGTGASLTTAGTYANGVGTVLQMAGGTVNTGGAMTNDGTIRGNGTIGGGGSFTNNSDIYADGGTLDFSGKNVTNLVGGTLTGGVWQAGEFSAGTLKLPGNVTTNAANLILQGVGSQFTNAANGNALSGLATNNGFLTLFDGASLTTGHLTNNGAVSVRFGDSVLNIGGNLTNQNNAAIFVDGGDVAATLNIAGHLSNDATSSVQVTRSGLLLAGTVGNSNTFTTGNGGGTEGGNTVNVAGLFTNNASGSLNLTGSGDVVTVGGLTNLGTVTIQNGTALHLSAGAVNNSNTMTVLAGGALNTFGAAYNQLAGATSVSGQALTGAFTNSGGATNVLNGGTLDVTTLSTSIALNVNAGGTMSTTLTTMHTGGVATIGGQFTSGGTYQLGSTGIVNIQAGGILGAPSYSAAANSTTTVSGTLNAPVVSSQGGMIVSNGGAVNASTSYTQFSGATQVFGTLNSASTNISNGQLSGDGGLVTGGPTSINNGASLLVGTTLSTAGTLNFGGPLTIANGATLFQVISGTTQGTSTGYSFLNLGGLGGQTLTLGATSILNLQQLVSFNPANGTVLTIASFGSLVGQFGSIVNQTFNGGTQSWAVNYLANAITLTAQNNGAVLVNALWNGPSGNWTNTAAGRFQCTPGTNPCLPNNNVNNTYDVTLNSIGNTLTLNNTSTPASITVNTVTISNGTLAIGPGATLTTTGAFSNNDTILITGGTISSGGAMTNAGGIIGNGTIGGAGSFTNTGQVQSHSGVLDLSGKNVTNLSAGTLTGGTWQSTSFALKLPGNISTNAARIIFMGAGSQITNASNGNALAGLSLNQGDLELYSAATLTTTTGLTNTGNILTLDPGTVLTVGGSLANNATGSVIVGTDSTLNTTGVTNAGFVLVDPNATLSNGVSAYSQSAGGTTVNGTLNTGSFSMTGGVLDVNTGGAFNAGSFQNNGGTANVNVGGTATVTGAYSQGSGATNVDGTVNTGSHSQSGGTTTVNNGGAITSAGAYTQTGGVTQINVGGSISTLTFAVNGGTTTVQGQLAATGGVSVGTNGTLNGTGNGTTTGLITGNVTNGGSVYGGTSTTAPGNLHIAGNYTQTAGGAYYENIASTSLNSQLFISGLAQLTGALHISLLSSFMPALNDVFVLMTYSSGTGNFSSFTVNGNAGLNINASSMFAIAYNATDVTLTVVSRGVGGEVPEPGTWVLVGTGALLLIRRQLRRRTKESRS